MAQDICIRNTAGPDKGQAVALRVNADKSIIYGCRIDAFQDTLYAFSDRQFYRSCYITGTVDFIFGRAAAVFQQCQIEARYSSGHTNTNTITAQSRHSIAQKSGFTIQRCNITATPDLAPHKQAVKTYLGRPWDALSSVVVMETFIDDLKSYSIHGLKRSVGSGETIYVWIFYAIPRASYGKQSLFDLNMRV